MDDAKTAFTEAMSIRLIELFGENIKILKGRSDSKKNKARKEIAEKLNDEFKYDLNTGWPDHKWQNYVTVQPLISGAP